MAEAKKKSTKKTAAKKATAKKSAAKKSTSKKSPAKKTTAKKTVAKKTAAKKTAAKKVAPSKSPPKKKAAAKKVAARETKPAAKGGRLQITQLRSPIGRPENQKATLKALGLRRIRHTVEHQDTPVIRGMVTKVIHLVKVEELPA